MRVIFLQSVAQDLLEICRCWIWISSQITGKMCFLFVFFSNFILTIIILLLDILGLRKNWFFFFFFKFGKLLQLLENLNF